MLAARFDAVPRERRWAVALPLVAFVLAALAVALPILAHVHLPLVDLPNHIARLYIEATRGGPLDTYYSYSFAFVPNSAADLIWALLGHPGSPERFSQIIMAIYAVGLIGATMVLSHVVHGRWLVWPAASAIVVFNSPFFWGFQNFVFTAPFAILALALWLAIERRALAFRCAVFVPIALLLYFMHFFAFCFLAIAVFGREVQLLAQAGPDWKRSLGRSMVLSIPFAAPVLWLAISVLTGPPSAAGSYTAFGAWERRLVTLMVPFLAPSGPDAPSLNWTGMAGYLALAGCLLTTMCSRGPKLVFNAVMAGPLAALSVAMLAAPYWLNGVAEVDRRLPFLVLASLVATTSWRGLGRRSAALIAILLATVILARGVAVERFADGHSADIADLTVLLDTLPEGSRVLPVRTSSGKDDLRLSHVQAYAVFLRNSFVPTLFQGVHDITVRPQWLASTHPAFSAVDEAWLDAAVAKREASSVQFVQDWDRKFTHVLLLDPQHAPLRAREKLRKVASSGRFTLFEVKADDPA
jgi:hypothetical protein